MCLTVLRGAWQDRPFDSHGEHYQVAGATTLRPPRPVPEIFFGGASPAAGQVAARHVVVYLTWGEPPGEIDERIVEYHRLGFDHLIFSGQPHLEEAYWFGEGVLPLLKREGLVAEGDACRPEAPDVVAPSRAI